MEDEEFEIEKEYLFDVEKTLDNLVLLNDNQIKKYKETYDRNQKDYMDKTNAPEVRKFLSSELKNLENSINYLLSENYRYGKVKYSPYFAKINLIENGENLFYYIGTKNISSKDNLMVVDWRTPVCSLFYNSTTGNTFYTAPIGKIEVELLSKRQFKIENSTLLNFYDATNNYCDDMLRESLNKSTSAYMKNIVSTLQSEQDEIIRNPISNSVVVNGIAGSGKTSVGMHRIAYLLYSDRENLTSKNVLIISPNKLFTEYISHLLPELGEENVTTENIITIFNNLMNDVGMVKQKNLMVEDITSGNSKRLIECEKKYSHEFLTKLDEFLSKFNSKEKIDKNLIASGLEIEKEMLKKYYFNENQSDIAKSIEITTERLISLYFYQKSNSVQNKIKTQIKNFFLKNVFKKSIVEIYKEFLNENNFDDNIITNGFVNFEDMPALCYIKLKILGLQQNYFIKQVFVDEMQDYDAITIFLIKYLFPKATFTMVGDYEQNLLFKANNKKTIDENFNDAKFYNLTTNYRSTSNISKFACSVVDKTYDSEFSREGEKPKIIQTSSFAENIEKIKQMLEVLKEKHQRIAVICKTQKEVELYKNFLPECFTLSENKNDIEIQKPILTCVFYSKGLEFDTVILPNVSEENYNSEIDKNILYVASTRALHKLYVFYIGNKSKLIKD